MTHLEILAIGLVKELEEQLGLRDHSDVNGFGFCPLCAEEEYGKHTKTCTYGRLRVEVLRKTL